MSLLDLEDLAVSMVLGTGFVAATLTGFDSWLVLLLGTLAGFTAARRGWRVTVFRYGFLVLLGAFFTVISHSLWSIATGAGASRAVILEAGPVVLAAESSRPGPLLVWWCAGAALVPGKALLDSNRKELRDLIDVLEQALQELLDRAR